MGLLDQQNNCQIFSKTPVFRNFINIQLFILLFSYYGFLLCSFCRYINDIFSIGLSVPPTVHIFQPKNRWADIDEVSNDRYAIKGHPKQKT